MENAAQILRMFDLKYKSISRERAYFLCATDKGKVALKKATNAEIVMAIHEMKQRLEQNNIATNKFCLAANGLPYAAIGYDIYTVSNYVPYNAADFCQPHQFKEIIKIVAKMHEVCNNIDVSHNFFTKAQLRINSFAPDEVYHKNFKALNDYKKIVLKKSRMSDFDMLLLNNHSRFMAVLNSWFEAAKTSNAALLETQALHSKQLCHNLLKEENVLIKDNEIFLTGFSEVSVAHGMNDLASLVKRYIKSCPQNAVSLTEVLSTYNEIVPLGNDEVEYFKSLLLFPNKFLELCQSYYSKKRAFTPRTFETRMFTLIDSYEFFETYTSL